MSKQEIISEATHLLDQLPADKASQVLTLLTYAVQEANADADIQAHYAKLIHQKEEDDLRRDIMWIVEHGGAFDWLHDEPDLYTDDDLLERYN